VLVWAAYRRRVIGEQVNESFLGRTPEQGEFRRVLQLAQRSDKRSKNGSEIDEGFVVLVHGLGGIGKSTLLRRFRDIAVEAHPNALVAEIVNCEIEQERNPSSYTWPAGPPIWQFLDRLYLAIKVSAEGRQYSAARFAKDFESYRQTMAAQPDLAQRAAAIGLDPAFRSRSSGQVTALSQAIGDVAALVPAPGAVTKPAAGLMQSALGAWAARGAGRVSEEAYDALLADVNRLVVSFAESARELSRRTGLLVVFIDTGELLGGALELLREAMRRSGRHVVWVLGLRLEADEVASLESEAARFRRTIHDSRLWQMPLSRFDDRTVEGYLRNMLGPAYPPDLDIDSVVQTTHGIPLAVYLVGRLLATGEDPVEALTPVTEERVSSVVAGLAERFLMHARHVPDLKKDLRLLYALALLYGDGDQTFFPPDTDSIYPSRHSRVDPAALATLWDVRPQQVSDELDNLARRHDFVLSGSRRLHQEIRGAILQYLLDPVRRSGVLDINERAEAYYRGRLAAKAHPSVDAQLEDQQWQNAVISLLWHTFWMDLDQGIVLLLQLFAVAVTVDRGFAEALLRVSSFFAPACPADRKQVIDGLEAVIYPWYSASGTARRAAVLALGRANTGLLLAPQPPPSVYRDLLSLELSREVGPDVPGRAKILVRLGRQVHEDGPTARAISTAARDLTNLVRPYRSAGARTQRTIVTALKLMVRFNEDDSYAHTSYSAALGDLGHYKEAESASREAIHLSPESSMSHANLGGALAGLFRFAEAETACREALRLDPDNSVAQHNLGAALSGLGRHAEAAEVYRELVNQDPQDSDASSSLVSELLLLSRPAEAEAAAREALRVADDNPDVNTALGAALLQLGRLTEAEAATRVALRRVPENPDYLGLLGSVLLQLGHPAEAEAATREALRLAEENPYLSATLGAAMLQLACFPEAEAAAREALRLVPDNPDYYNLLGVVLLIGMGQRTEAEACFLETLRLNPEHVDGHVNLGILTLHYLGEADRAEREFQAALRISAETELAHTNMGTINVVRGDLPAAGACFSTALHYARGASAAYCEIMLGAIAHTTDPSAAERRYRAALDALRIPTAPTTVITPFRKAELEAMALAGLGDAAQAGAILSAAAPKRAKGNVLQRMDYDLIGGAESEAVEALLAVWRRVALADSMAVGPWGDAS
jgi:Flp pilus assembly protein TadD